MNTKRALILEKDGQDFILLTSEGEFIQTKLAIDAAVGEEIELPINQAAADDCEIMPLKPLEKVKTWFQEAGSRHRRWASIAAILVFALVMTFNWNLLVHPQAVAAISLDFNPRLELTVDRKNSVLEVNPINQDAQELVNTLKLRGKPLNAAISAIIQEAAEKHFIDLEQDWVVVGISPLVEEQTQPAQTPTAKEIEAIVYQEVQKAGMTGKVATFQVSSEQRAKAQTEGMTTAEYGLYEVAKQAGLEVQPETVKDAAERVRLLENEAIQAEIQNYVEQLVEKFQGNSPDNRSKETKGSKASFSMPWAADKDYQSKQNRNNPGFYFNNRSFPGTDNKNKDNKNNANSKFDKENGKPANNHKHKNDKNSKHKDQRSKPQNNKQGKEQNNQHNNQQGNPQKNPQGKSQDKQQNKSQSNQNSGGGSKYKVDRSNSLGYYFWQIRS